MLNINFEIDENILSRNIVQRNIMPTDFANYLWEKYNDSYRILKDDDLSKDIDFNILEEIKQQPFFNEILKQAEENCERIKNNWGKKYQEINYFLNNIARTDFLLETTTYIVPPSFYRGVNIGNDYFIYGHPNGLQDENYDLVYLVHESLHSIFPKDYISHAIIENITDIELCKYLNQSNNDNPNP